MSYNASLTKNFTNCQGIHDGSKHADMVAHHPVKTYLAAFKPSK